MLTREITFYFINNRTNILLLKMSLKLNREILNMQLLLMSYFLLEKKHKIILKNQWIKNFLYFNLNEWSINYTRKKNILPKPLAVKWILEYNNFIWQAPWLLIHRNLIYVVCWLPALLIIYNHRKKFCNRFLNAQKKDDIFWKHIQICVYILWKDWFLNNYSI